NPKMLKEKRDLLLKTPDRNYIIESKLNGQQFVMLSPLLMTLKRKQVEIVALIVDIIKDNKDLKTEALKQWEAWEESEKTNKQARESQYDLEMKVLIEEI